MDKDVVYIHNAVLLSHIKMKSLFVTTWMDLEGIMLNKSDKNKYSMISIICGIQKTVQMNKHNKTGTYS